MYFGCAVIGARMHLCASASDLAPVHLGALPRVKVLQRTVLKIDVLSSVLSDVRSVCDPGTPKQSLSNNRSYVREFNKYPQVILHKFR